MRAAAILGIVVIAGSACTREEVQAPVALEAAQAVTEIAPEDSALKAREAVSRAREEALARTVGVGTLPGQPIYDQLCWTCHGKYGRGEGPVAEFLSVQPPDMTVPEVLAGRSDDAIVDALTGSMGEAGRAHTPMVVASVVGRDAMRDAIEYMRSLSVPGKHASLAAGRDLFQSFCWLCHGTAGDGNGPAVINLPGTKPRDFTSSEFVIEGREDEIRKTIALGAAESSLHGSEYMPEWGTKLSPQQIEDILEYIKTFKNP